MLCMKQKYTFSATGMLQVLEMKKLVMYTEVLHTVLRIYREDVYSNREEWEKSNPTEPYPENIAEIIIAKHRNGPTGTVPLYFNRDVVKFDSLQYPNSNS